MRHLQITFTDGSIEDLNSRFDRWRVEEGILQTRSSQTYNSNDQGPNYPIVNIKKWDWVEGR